MELVGPRGTEDLLGEKAYRFRHLENVLRQIAHLYGYDEAITPIFEHTELFTRSVGETTDIVQKEMYTFTDKGNRSLTLRPEGTASCVRSFVEHKVFNQSQPTKWFYIGPMFRNERPQAGRFRQFHQFGVEVFGSQGPGIDAEVIALMVDIMNRLGLPDHELQLNSVGCPRCRLEYRQALIEFMKPFRSRLCPDCQNRIETNPLRVLDCKNEECGRLVEGMPLIYEYLCPSCNEHFNTVQALLEGIGVDFALNPRLVRGLDYYTQTAFEIHMKGIGAQSAVGGGGRYNGLIAEVGGPEMPGIGFALGMERLLMAMERAESLPASGLGLDVFVAVLDGAGVSQGLRLLKSLRDHGLRCDQDYNLRGLKAQMKFANKKDARLVVIIGEDELKSGQLTVRDMAKGEQESVSGEHIIEFIKNRLIG